MSAILNPYINLGGTAREALEFYHGALGGTVSVMTFEEGGMGDQVGPDEKDLVMHGQVDGDHGFTLMVSDSPAHMGGAKPLSGVSMSLSGDDETLLTGLWEKLSAGGSIQEPLSRAPWGDSFGMFTDRFGVPWMVNIRGAGASA
ncbi:VOC family protein [Pseudolysinimonas sp.]|uniref:VOC family protein n=1 Tax=Pseudolysinimonas sp. TaxID=2680009 RepID=UPI003F7F7953